MKIISWTNPPFGQSTLVYGDEDFWFRLWFWVVWYWEGDYSVLSLSRYVSLRRWIAQSLQIAYILSLYISISSLSRYIPISMVPWIKIALKSFSLCQCVCYSMACVERFFTKSVFWRWFVIVCWSLLRLVFIQENQFLIEYSFFIVPCLGLSLSRWSLDMSR